MWCCLRKARAFDGYVIWVKLRCGAHVWPPRKHIRVKHHMALIPYSICGHLFDSCFIIAICNMAKHTLWWFFGWIDLVRQSQWMRRLPEIYKRILLDNYVSTCNIKWWIRFPKSIVKISWFYFSCILSDARRISNHLNCTTNNAFN